MAGRSIGDLFLTIKGDLSKFAGEVKKESEKAGDESGKSFSAKFTTATKMLGRAVIGVGLGLATKQMLELDDATAKFRAETGATAEEAKRAGEAINEMAGRNLQPIAAIGDTLSAVTKNMAVSGDEAEELTQQFLEFAEATGQDATQAVESFDDILDSWGLTTADAADLMDKLIVSVQKFGGSIEEREATLAALAPAMKAANMQIDDGIALLNLFGAKGIDANVASAAFAKSLTKVKSPEELKALITDISETDDAFARARKAGDLFGARAGAKLGNALAGANLDDYVVDMQEAEGATLHAADAIKGTLPNQIKLALNGAMSTITDFLGPLGPVLPAFASLTTLLGPTLAKVFSSLAGPGSVVMQAAAAFGAKTGLAYIGAAAAGTGLMGAAQSAILAIGPLAIPVAFIISKDWIGKTIEDIATDVSKLLGGGQVNVTKLPWQIKPEAPPVPSNGRILGEGWMDAADKTGKELGERTFSPLVLAAQKAARESEADFALMLAAFGANAQHFKDIGVEVEAAVKALRLKGWTELEIRALWDSSEAAGKALGAGFTGPKAQQYLSAWNVAWSDLPKPIIDGAAGAADALRNLGPGLVAAIKGTEKSVDAAMDEVRWLIRNPGKWKEAITDVGHSIRDLNEAELKARRQGRPGLAAYEASVKADQIAAWEELTGLAWDNGLSVSQNLARGMHKNKPQVHAGGVAVAGAASKPIAALPDKATTWGHDIVSHLANGITASKALLASAADTLARSLHGHFVLSSPAKEGPLSERGGPRAWGMRFGEFYTQGVLSGMLGGIPAVQSAIAGLTMGLSPALSGGAFNLSASSHQIVEHRHTIDLESARNLHEAGYDERGVVDILLAEAARTAGTRYLTPVRS